MLKGLIHSWERKLVRKDSNRVVRPFEWGLEFLEDTPTHSLKAVDDATARRILFDFNDRAIRSSTDFFAAAETVVTSFDGCWLTFSSPVHTPYDENNTAYARYFPVGGSSKNGTSQLEVARAKGRAVIVLPQWNADGEGHVGLCRLLNVAGIASLRLSLPYHDRRMLGGFGRADYMVSSNVGRTIQSCRQAVLEARMATDWLLSRGYDRVGIVGTSIGSCISFLTFAHEPRLKVGVFNHVSRLFGDVVWEGISTAHVRRALETTLSLEDVRRGWMVVSPISYIERLASNPRRGLLISARFDLTFPPRLSRLLFEACERQGIHYDRRLLPWGHYTMGISPFKYYAGLAIVNYFRKHL
jgi:hypothetical protein